MQHLTRFDVALPFLVSAVLIVVAAFVALLVLDRTEAVVDKWAGESKGGAKALPDAFQPSSIAKVSGWIIDTSQILTSLLAPLVGLVLLLKAGAAGHFALAYLGAVAITLIVFVVFVRLSPDSYGWPGSWSLIPKILRDALSPVVVLLVIINLAGAGVAYAIAP